MCGNSFFVLLKKKKKKVRTDNYYRLTQHHANQFFSCSNASCFPRVSAGISTTSPCYVTLCRATSVNGSTCSEGPHGKRPSTCVTAGLPLRMSCRPATVGRTGQACPWQTSWTARLTWPTTARSVCWLTSAWWAVTTCHPLVSWSEAACCSPAPRPTCVTWRSTAWRSFSARRSTCSSGRSACISYGPSRRSTARAPPAWASARRCGGASRGWTPLTWSCTNTPRSFSCGATSTPGRSSTRRSAWGGGSRGSRSSSCTGPIWLSCWDWGEEQRKRRRGWRQERR